MKFILILQPGKQPGKNIKK